MKNKAFLLGFILSLIIQIDVFASNVATLQNSQGNFSTTEQFIEKLLNEKMCVRNYKGFNSIIANNGDGTNTMYVFNDDIYYLDEKGKTVLKDLSIVSSSEINKIKRGYVLKVKSNNIDVDYPLSLNNNGIIVESIELIAKDSNAVLSEFNNDSADYEDVFDGVTISCSPQYKGTEINTRANSIKTLQNISYKINCVDDYEIYENGGKIIIDTDEHEYEIIGSEILDNEGNVVGESFFSLNDEGDINMNYLTYSENVDSDDIINVNESTENVSTNTYIIVNNGYIKDATFFENSSCSSMTHNLIGTHDNYGITRTLLEFDLSALEDIPYDSIVSASYNTYAYNLSENETIAEVYMNASSWSKNYNSLENLPEIQQSYKLFEINISSGNYGSSEFKNINITSAVQAWLQGMDNYGLMIKSKDDKGRAKLSSSINEENPHYLKVTYSNDSDTPNTKGIENNEYYMINKKSGKALTIEGDDNYNLIQDDLVQENKFKWNLTYYSTENGIDYYVIRNIDTAMFMETEVNNGEYDVNIANQNFTDLQKWQIKRNWDGSYKLIPKISEQLKAIGINGTITSDKNMYLINNSVDFDKSEDWTLIPVKKNIATLYGMCRKCFKDIVSTETIGGVQDSLEINEYECVNMHVCVNDESNINEAMALQDYKLRYDEMAERGIEQLFDSDIFYSFAHGSPSRLQFYEPNIIGEESRIGLVNSIEAADNSEDDNEAVEKYVNVYGVSDYYGNLNKLMMCILISCEVGSNDGNDSLIGTMYEEGAHCILSHTEVIGYYDGLEWSDYFNLALNFMSFEKAKDFADKVFFYFRTSNSNGNITSKLILGDTSFSYNYDVYSDNSNDVENVTKTIMLNGNEIGLIPITFDFSSESRISHLNLYKDANGNIYGFSKSTDRLLLYFYNYKYNEIGNKDVLDFKAYAKASEFLTDIGYDMLSYTYSSSGDYSSEFIINYNTDEADAISKCSVYVKADNLNNAYVTFYMAEE